MRVGTKVAAYAGGLAVAFGAAWTAGASTDRVVPAPEPSHAAAVATAELPGGLAVSQQGYTLRPATSVLRAGGAQPFRFTVTGPDGQVVRDYTTGHEKELHLIVVGRDLSDFQHLHPGRDAAGTWTLPLTLPAAGTYRMYADFTPAALAGDNVVLGADLFAAGPFVPRPLPAASTTSTVDGYQVALTGVAVAGQDSQLTFTVTKAGRPVTDLQPYLGAFGHLVSLRQGDLAYLHTHPAQEARPGESGGPQVQFGADFPTAGSYRVFLDFQHAGQVRTAAFTVTVAAGGATAPTAAPDGHGH